MKNGTKPETQAWLYKIPRSQQTTSLNISRSPASCPLAMIVINQLVSHGTRTPMPKRIWEAEDQGWSQRSLSGLCPRAGGFAEPSQRCVVDKK